MTPRIRMTVTWIPRLAGVAMSLFLAMFALDAFTGQSLLKALPDFMIHLAPAAICGAVVAVAWRRPWIGAAAFGALAIGYALMVPTRPDWIAVIGGPLMLVAVLFGMDAYLNARTRPRAGRAAV